MKMILAQPRGFCAGVGGAVEIVEPEPAKYAAPIGVRHGIVHNGYVGESLEAKAVRFAQSLSEVPCGALTIFSAHFSTHGVARGVEDEALGVPDPACPLVVEADRQGMRTAATGWRIVGIGPRPVDLVQAKDDVALPDLPADTPLAYFTQTTLSVDTKDAIAALKHRFSDILGPETEDIWRTTKNRQTAMRQSSKLVDVVLVVGANNSSNSNRLRDTGSEASVPGYLVAERDEPGLDIGVDGAPAPEVPGEEVIGAPAVPRAYRTDHLASGRRRHRIPFANSICLPNSSKPKPLPVCLAGARSS